jgi:predicted short-subunit dehydrogenase-like oxidoreductase (DUF2520 family)
VTRIFIVGAGKCGLALARTLEASGHEIVGSTTRSTPSVMLAWPNWTAAALAAGAVTSLPLAEIVWMTLPDDALTDVPELAGPHQLVFHASGAVAAEVLRATQPAARSVAACHPLQSYPGREVPAEHSRDISFGIQGESEAVDAAQALVRSMGSRPFVVADEDAKALYHAACCVASNAMVALIDRAVTLFAGAGVSRSDAFRALSPLVSGTASNLASAAEPVDVLTGPLARGQRATIDKHRRVIATRLPEESAHYEHICEEIRALMTRSLLESGAELPEDPDA